MTLAAHAAILPIAATLALVGASPADGRPADLRRTYGTCYSLQGRMADGSWVRPRSAASNVLPLGTHIRLVGRPFLRGMRRFVVRDTGGALGDGHLDLWHPSTGSCLRWGARPLTYKLGWRKP